MKVQFLLSLWLATIAADAAYISRMATMNRMRQPSVFRPGVTMQQRPWAPTRLVQAASHRAPYVLYRGGPHRYIQSKPYTSAPRNVFTVSKGPWKSTTRLQHTASTPEYEFVRAAASHTRPNGGTGAIHTIPAPNLSLSEKPIVVLETDSGQTNYAATSDAPKQVYEVTEKYVDPQFYHSVLGTKSVEAAPASFSKHGSVSHQQDNNMLVRNAAALQLANELGFQAVAVPQGTFLPPQPMTIQFQGFHGIQNHQDVLQPGLDGLVISPNAFFQNNDPMFLQKIQNQLLQRYPAVEFVPYNMNADFRPTVSQQGQTFVVTENAPAHSHQHLSVIPIQQNENDNHKTVVRETQEKTVITLIPQAFVAKNVTEKPVEVVSVTEPQNVTVELVTADSKPATTTVKYIIEASTENNQKATPIYYAQVGQSVGDVIASGFYSAINDVRAAAALAQVSETPKPEETKQPENINNQENVTSTTSSTSTTSTTVNPDVKTFFIQNTDKNESNQTSNDLKSLLGVPFAKPDSVKVAYTLYRADDKDSKVTQDGKVYAGQIVEATISEDQDFNNEKANLISRRPPIRLIPVVDNIEPQSSTTSSTTTTTEAAKITVVKAKIPPRSKLTFDDKTGEPVLRIYANYVDSPAQRDRIASKLANIKRVKEVLTRTQDTKVDWKAGTVKSLDQGRSSSGTNTVTQFGLKLRSRMDNIAPIFDDNE